MECWGVKHMQESLREIGIPRYTTTTFGVMIQRDNTPQVFLEPTVHLPCQIRLLQYWILPEV